MSGRRIGLVLSIIRTTRNAWDDQSEQLRGGHKRLSDAQNAVADLGDRVAPAARTYLTTWLREVQNHADTAKAHADGLAHFTTSVVHLDERSAAELRAVLPWDQRNTAVRDLPFGVPQFPTDDPGPAPEPTSGTTP